MAYSFFKGERRTAFGRNALKVGVFLIMFVLSVSVGLPAKAANDKTVKSCVFVDEELIYGKGVQLSWKFDGVYKEVKVTEWRIYRYYYEPKPDGYLKLPNKDGKLIATVDGSENTYLDEDDSLEEGKEYYYWVYGYKVKDGVETWLVACAGEGHVVIGVSEVYPEETLPEYTCTATSAILDYTGSGSGYMPTGFELYRKVKGEKKYTLVADIPNTESSYGFKYTDEDVETNVTYLYKARSYYDTGEKRLYSKYSSPEYRTPGNPKGIYTVEAVSSIKGKIKTLTVHITSDEDNGDLYYTNYKDSLPVVTISTTKKGEYKEIVTLKAVKFSRDGKKWKKFGKKKVVLKAGEEMWIKFQTNTKKAKKFKLPKKFVVGGDLSYKDVYYSTFYYKSGTGELEVQSIGDFYT